MAEDGGGENNPDDEVNYTNYYFPASMAGNNSFDEADYTTIHASMAEDDDENNLTGRPVIEVEFDVNMHCKACERSVLKTLCKLEGVEKVMTDMENNKAIVVGRIEPEKALKKLRKKTGKKAEIAAKEGGECEEQREMVDAEDGGCDGKQGLGPRFLVFDDSFHQFVLDLETFSEDNPHACTIIRQYGLRNERHPK